MKKQLRILYALGPGDVVNSYRHWSKGNDYVAETSLTFSGQFFEFCRRAGHSGYAISYFPQAGKLADAQITAENRPKRLARHGIRFHISEALYALSVMWTALRWRADVVICDSGTTHWALLAPLKLAGVTVIGVLHNVVWPSGFKPAQRSRRLILAADGWFWRHVADGLVSVSPECESQVRELAGKFEAPAAQTRAQYDRGAFIDIPPPPPATARPFNVMFAGRVERNKGVFDIVKMARILEARRPGQVRFEVCGDGSALQELKAFIEDQQMGHAVRTHGKLIRPQLLKFYADCHTVIVPTRSDFCEGLPMVCAEAILCGRPVITSRLSNALEVLSGAVAVAQPDDVGSYVDAIERMMDDPATYEKLRAGCRPVQEPFFDAATSLTATLATVVSKATA